MSTRLFLDFSKVFYAQGENKANTLASGLPKENVTALMMLYKKTKAIVY